MSSGIGHENELRKVLAVSRNPYRSALFTLMANHEAENRNLALHFESACLLEVCEDLELKNALPGAACIG
ncbi:MAG: hypothetical protein KDD60_08965, partial [Bdellovibrionales bacterium]|nr:hypothetical protein [Bdellovibrionales bacterium]